MISSQKILVFKKFMCLWQCGFKLKVNFGFEFCVNVIFVGLLTELILHVVLFSKAIVVFSLELYFGK